MIVDSGHLKITRHDATLMANHSRDPRNALSTIKNDHC